MYGIKEDKVDRLVEVFSEAERISIVTHSRPDGDALGSSNALRVFLKEIMGKDAMVVVPNEYGEYLSFIAANDIIVGTASPLKAQQRIEGSDVIVGIDLNATSRMDQLGPIVDSSHAFKVLIDHHLNPDAEHFGLCFSKTDISSACEVLYQILMSTPAVGGNAAVLPGECATALFTGMTTDTNNFANSVYPSTLGMASALLEAGVDRDFIIERLYHSYRETRIRAFSYLLGQKMKIIPGGVAYIILTQEDWDRFGLKQGETEGLVNVPLSIDEVKMSVFLRQDNGCYRVSIRSKKGVSANGFAREFFNGGGHEQAAGGSLRWPEDMPEPECAATYIEKSAARFMHTKEI